MLPRIMPAPQALLRPLRPPSLPTYPAKVTGVYTGVSLDALNFFANIIHPLELQPVFGFKVLEIFHRDEWEWKHSLQRSEARKVEAGGQDNATTEVKATATASGADLEPGRLTSKEMLKRRPTMKDHISYAISNAPRRRNKAFGRARLWSPLNIISVVSSLMSIGLIVAAIVWHDAVAIIAVSLISIAASVICAASWWRPIMMSRRITSTSPRGDVIIRTKEGGILLIRCSEDVARDLYWGSQECLYFVSGIKYRFLMTLGTVLIIPSVILMGNCTFDMQILMGVAYTIQNILYWVLGSLPQHIFWDLWDYVWGDVTPEDAKNAHQTNWDAEDADSIDNRASYTRTLWYAIRETKRTAWTIRSGSVPNTPPWKEWLEEAEEAAKSENRIWPAVARKDEILWRRPPTVTENETGAEDDTPSETESKELKERRSVTPKDSDPKEESRQEILHEMSKETKNEVKNEVKNEPGTDDFARKQISVQEVQTEAGIQTMRQVRDVATQTTRSYDEIDWDLD